jgi:hypothetical protein
VKYPILFLLTLTLAIAMVVPSAWGMNYMRSSQPYGGYCRGMKWGWYGASRAINNVVEVRSLLAEYLKESDLTIGEIQDDGAYFKANIYDKDGIEADILIVEKRSSRIRSIY